MHQQKKGKNEPIQITLHNNLVNQLNKNINKSISSLDENVQYIILEQSMHRALTYLLESPVKHLKEIMAYSRIEQKAIDSYSSFEYKYDEQILDKLQNLTNKYGLREFESAKPKIKKKNILTLFIRFGLKKELDDFDSKNTNFYKHCREELNNNSCRVKLLSLDPDTLEPACKPRDSTGRSIGRKIAKLINAKRKPMGLKRLSDSEKTEIIKITRKLYTEKKNMYNSDPKKLNIDELANEFYITNINEFIKYHN